MLKNPINELCLFFDMEWVPDADGSRRLYGLPGEMTEIEAMNAMWQKAAYYDAEKNPRPFVKYMFSRVASIAFLSRKAYYNSEREPVVEFGLYSLPELPVHDDAKDESEIIRKFLYWVGKRCPQLVGFNSSESDVQVLIQRALINEIAAPDFCRRPDKPWEGNDYFKKWDNEDHLDLIKLFSGRREMTPKLDELAKLCGYPGKIDVKGDQVVDLWLDGDLTKIIEYNQIDVLNTYLVWLRVVYFAGALSGERYFFEQEAFREFLEQESQKPNRAFLAEFLSAWPHEG
ncbi:MAG: ribonuclease H-like domain-containing protein [Acidobacteria bacterium]|nr:ribonuclease H-like domain-containing protein [Acidobacteriota bacterium]